jgi:hypothetical protein
MRYAFFHFLIIIFIAILFDLKTKKKRVVGERSVRNDRTILLKINNNNNNIVF